MLTRNDPLPSIAGKVQPPAPRSYTGRELTRHVRQLDPAGRAFLAARLCAGDVTLVKLTERQARLLTDHRLVTSILRVG